MTPRYFGGVIAKVGEDTQAWRGINTDASQRLRYLSPVSIWKHEQELKGVVLGGGTHITCHPLGGEWSDQLPVLAQSLLTAQESARGQECPRLLMRDLGPGILQRKPSVLVFCYQGNKWRALVNMWIGKSRIKNLFWDCPGGSVVRLCISTTGDADSIPGQGTKIPHTA